MHRTRVAIVYLLVVLIGIIAIARIIDLQYIHRPDSYGKVNKATERVDSTEGVRGSIIAADGRYLAFSTPQYNIRFDTTVPSDTIFNSLVDSLAEKISYSFGEMSVKDCRNLLTTSRAAKNQYLKVIKRSVSYDEMKEISSFPIFSLGKARGGIIIEKLDHREYPYGKLAYRTLGYLRNNRERPRIGLEASLDTVLRGIPGARPMRLVEHGEWIRNVEKEEIPAQDGTDVQVSIDINMQDIAERALLHRIQEEPDLQAGCVIIMETATGAIKAMVNMEKQENGSFSETYNYAIGRAGEPGSVFKLVTLVTMLEEGKVTLDTHMNVPVSWQPQSKGKPLVDNYLRNYPGGITVRKGLEISSNNVFRKLAYDNYIKNPQKYVDILNNERKVSYNFDFDINGMGKAYIYGPDQKGSAWSPIDLAQIGMGYTVQMTPLHIITFYNAIANGGVMMKPHLIQSYSHGGVITKRVEPEVIGRVCSEETARAAREALRDVVIGSNGTARRAFAGCKVEVAGKTGTARVVLDNGKYEMGGMKKHQGSFVGFFPYENPKYTVMCAVWSKLANKNFYGGTWAAPPVREIVDNIYATTPSWNEPVIGGSKLPEIAEYPNRSVNDTITGVPNLKGMGARDAVYMLESQGYRVSLEGAGVVIGQNPEPGKLTEVGSVVTLNLGKNKEEKKDET